MVLFEMYQEKVIEYVMKMKDDESGDIIEVVSGVFVVIGDV